MRFRGGLVVRVAVGGVALAVMGSAGAASAAPVRTENGVRCTIVGTPRNDVLTGSGRRDVICGRGGNDRVDGRGGNDLVDGGAGVDTVTGGTGDDVLLGGLGDDSLRGAAGADLVRGGSGRDTLRGEAGADRVYGEDGDDTGSGAAGNDVVSGGPGDDELSGDEGNDHVDGGTGANLCDLPAGSGDTQVRCLIDQAAPEVGQVSVTPATADVSNGQQLVQVQVRVTDDTGVRQVQIGNVASRVSGTPRDGTWATTIRVPRFVEPGPRSLDIHATDRVGRTWSTTRQAAYTVVNTAVDQEMPEVVSLRLSTSAVDVRSAPGTIAATARITDDLAGPTDVFLCPSHLFGTGSPRFRQAGGCTLMEQSAGTPRDSTWRASYVVPRGAPSGRWNVAVWVDDAAGNRANDFWMGPDELAANYGASESRYRPLPGGSGVFTVTGTDVDLTPPALGSLRLDPAVVDTSRGAVPVTVEVAATDAVGVTDVDLFVSGYAGYPDRHTWTDLLQISGPRSLSLARGTKQDGAWRATFTVPGGTPDGEYFMQVMLRDASNGVSWVSPDSGWTTDNEVLTTELAPGGVRFVVKNS